MTTFLHNVCTIRIYNYQKAAIDLGNDLLSTDSWGTTYANSPHRNLLPEDNKRHSEDHIAESYPLAVNIKAKEASMDGFIDNIINITVDYKYWIERAKIAALLVIHTLFRPMQESEPLKHNDPLSLGNITGEEKLAKCKMCLG